MAPRYKFVEVAPVTSESLEEAVNEHVQQGWTLDGIRFVVTEHSKRPQMAFVAFTREERAPPALAPVPRDPGPDTPPAVIVAGYKDDVE